MHSAQASPGANLTAARLRYMAGLASLARGHKAKAKGTCEDRCAGIPRIAHHD